MCFTLLDLTQRKVIDLFSLLIICASDGQLRVRPQFDVDISNWPNRHRAARFSFSRFSTVLFFIQLSVKHGYSKLGIFLQPFYLQLNSTALRKTQSHHTHTCDSKNKSLLLLPVCRLNGNRQKCTHMSELPAACCSPPTATAPQHTLIHFNHTDTSLSVWSNVLTVSETYKAGQTGALTHTVCSWGQGALLDWGKPRPLTVSQRADPDGNLWVNKLNGSWAAASDHLCYWWSRVHHCDIHHIARIKRDWSCDLRLHRCK